jgi:predicted acylesterase/phospholipase RssA
MLESEAFTRSIGVFEGGGVRGAAFAGAYRAAKMGGIELVGTVGTSSGSIAAVLIAAGLTPEETIDQMGTSFINLLKRGKRPKSGVKRAVVVRRSLHGCWMSLWRSSWRSYR